MCIRRKAHKITKKQLRIIEIFNKMKGAYHQNLNQIRLIFQIRKYQLQWGHTREKSYQLEAQIMLILEEKAFTCFIIRAQNFMVKTFETTQSSLMA